MSAQLQLMSSWGNHLQISYGESAAPSRQAPEDKWNFSFGRSARPIIEWRAELILAAVQIHGLSRKTPLLYVDGSFASQVMVQAFRWSKMPFSCVVPRFVKDLNLVSFSQSILFLEGIEAPYEIVDFDLEGFFMNPETMTWTQKYSSDLPSQLVGMKVWQHLATREVPVVFPMGFPLFKKAADGWKVVEYEKDYGLFQFQKEHGLMGVPSFFKWAPETIMALMLDPTLRALMTNVRKEVSITDKILKEVFSNYFPILGDKNWTGFERAEFTIKRFHQTSKANFQGSLTAYAYPYVDYCARLEMDAATAEAMTHPPRQPRQTPKVNLA